MKSSTVNFYLIHAPLIVPMILTLVFSEETIIYKWARIVLLVVIIFLALYFLWFPMTIKTPHVVVEYDGIGNKVVKLLKK